MAEFTVYMAGVSYLVTKYRFVNNDSTIKIGYNPPMYVVVAVSFQKKEKQKKPQT